jgi:hypothetical protein
MSRTATFTEKVTSTFEILNCSRCDIPWAMTDTYVDHRRDDGKTFYCPNGHGQVFKHTLREKNEQLQEQLDAARQLAREERAAAEREQRRHAATKGQLTKARKRAAGGVCPCCNRSFVDMARHMATKHPGFGDEAS